MSDDVRRSPDQPEPDQPEPARPELEGPEDDALLAEASSAAAASDIFEQAGGAGREPAAEPTESAPAEEGSSKQAPTAKLDRLQKILAKAGIASRRHAEELITQGRVQVNGQVVTELGTKADPAHDHIRVDGKLLQGSERHRYFMLNKPKGFVTTVSDPEGRPTIMQFFAKMRERLYPVGRLDYMSEGLLLVTNDGEMANKLTRAASGVEKIYLVKVSGQPSEEDLERLREGVPIDREKPGSGRVHTAPAQIRRFHPGKSGPQRSGGRGSQRAGSGSRGAENPWFEVVLVEGRNRELRKMFEEIGHHVEKIRRVGYGPLVLDLEPGKFRELEPEEVENLRKLADGKFHKAKPREPRHGARREHRTEEPKGSQRQDLRKEHRGKFRSESGEGFRLDRGGAPNRGKFRSESSQGFRPSRDRTPDRGKFRSESGQGFRPDRRGTPNRGKFRTESSQAFRPDRGGREDRGKFRSESGQGFRPDRGGTPNRGKFRTESSQGFRPDRGGREDRGKFRSDTRFEERPPRLPDQKDRPPRRDREERSLGESRGRGRNFAGTKGRGDSGRFKRFGAQPRRPEFRDSQEAGTERPERRSFDRGNREESGPPKPFRRGENKPRFDRPGRKEAESRQRGEARSGRPDEERSSPPKRRFSSSRPGGYKRGKPGTFGAKSGSVRSGSGRRSDRKPGRGGKPRP